MGVGEFGESGKFAIRQGRNIYFDGKVGVVGMGRLPRWRRGISFGIDYFYFELRNDAWITISSGSYDMVECSNPKAEDEILDTG